jgi:hypothetical protein
MILPGAQAKEFEEFEEFEEFGTFIRSSGRSLVYKLTGALELRCRAFTLWAKTDTNREETDECSETACRSKDGGM